MAFKINPDLLSDDIFDIEEKYYGENGFYIKFKNGYILQSKRVLFTIDVLLWANGTYYQDISMGNWLIPFVDNSGFYPILINEYCESPASHLNQVSVVASPSVELVSASVFRCTRPDDAINPLNVTYAAVRVAFGRWK